MKEIHLTFEDISVADANKLAKHLQSYLKTETEIDSNIVKESKDTMDFGATLAIVLSANSIIAIAKGIADWIRLHQSKKLVINADGSLIGENLSSGDIEKILQEKIKN